MKLFGFLFFLLLSINLNAQTWPKSFPAIAKRVKTINSMGPDSLAQKLTSPYKTDIEKVWSIFRWITENIIYDTLGYYHPEKLYEGLWEQSWIAKPDDGNTEYNRRIVQKILIEKKAVCDGYSRLFKTLCDSAKIRCEIITGYIRWYSDPIGQRTNRGHAWNAVLIDGKWKLIDATWASGHSVGQSREIVKSFDPFFFCTDPVHLFNDHYPDDKKWTFLPNTPSLDQFYSFPFYYPSFYKFKFSSVSPTTGYISVSRKNRIATFELVSNEPKKDVFIYESANNDSDTAMVISSSQPETIYKIDKNKITCHYTIQSDKAKSLNVIFNGKRILTYEIKFIN
jgi:transglutaminase/protease-like cytokinesis protein 3